MFEQLASLPNDPILGLSAEYAADSNPMKVDLGVGIYKNAAGATPIMAAISQAQAQWHEIEETKAYVSPAGVPGFNESMLHLILGENHSVLQQQRAISVQTPGGCGALRLAAELIQRSRPESSVWVSTPTWANHIPLLGGAGIHLQEYPYYDGEKHHIDFDGMMAALATAPAGDLVLLHGCCHNPSGADLTQSQWRDIAALLGERGLIPFVDIAYQGLGDGLDEDAWGLRYLAEQLPEVIIASSCSKNFGLYRERVGAVIVVTAASATADTCKGQLNNIARGLYSMPPSHGAALVNIILTTPSLNQQWRDEVSTMRQRIWQLRTDLVAKLQRSVAGNQFDFIASEKGMFSFLGITPEQVQQLKRDFSIYMVNSSRINVAGLNQQNSDYLVEGLLAVINK